MSYYKLKDIIFLGIWIGIFYFIFYSQVYNGYPSDLVAHLSFYEAFTRGEINSNPGFYFTTFIIDSIGLNSYNAAIIVLTCFAGVIMLIINKTLYKFLLITDNERLFLLGSLMIVIAVYIPFFNSPYLGQFAANVWHNPTLFAVKPFAYLSFIAFMGISTNERVGYAQYLVLTLLLVLSLVFKPNFITYFVPSVLIYMLIYHRTDLKKWISLFLVSIPIVLVLAIQYLLTFKMSASDGIAISPFMVWNAYSPNWLISFLLSVAFPLSLTLLNIKKTLNNRYIVLGWICVLVSFAQYALLIETGPRAFDGNWGWGLHISISILFLFSVIEWFNWLKVEGDGGEKTIVNVIFALHLVSGIFYLFQILLGHSYN